MTPDYVAIAVVFFTALLGWARRRDYEDFKEVIAHRGKEYEKEKE